MSMVYNDGMRRLGATAIERVTDQMCNSIDKRLAKVEFSTGLGHQTYNIVELQWDSYAPMMTLYNIKELLVPACEECEEYHSES